MGSSPPLSFWGLLYLPFATKTSFQLQKLNRQQLQSSLLIGQILPKKKRNFKNLPAAFPLHYYFTLKFTCDGPGLPLTYLLTCLLGVAATGLELQIEEEVVTAKTKKVHKKVEND